MVFRVGLENNIEGHSLAWVLGHPGCFVTGRSAEDALERLPVAIENYITWIQQNATHPWLDLGEVEYQVEESWEDYRINEQFELVEGEGYEINAWFLDDWKPLTEADIQRGLQLLQWSRVLLLESTAGLNTAQLEQIQPGERWSIYGILRHVGGAEWWYLDRLGLAPPREQVPEEPFERLEKVRALLAGQLVSWRDHHHVVGIEGEFWSPRKLLRRAVWHELDHVNHIQRLRKETAG
jgi:hypothetical protein